MDRTLLQIDDTTHRLRRVGRLARRRMRLEGAKLTNGTHTDGRLTVTISGLGDPSAGAPDTFDWTADRPIALVIVRAGVDGDDVSFNIGPARAGSDIRGRLLPKLDQQSDQLVLAPEDAGPAGDDVMGGAVRAGGRRTGVARHGRRGPDAEYERVHARSVDTALRPALRPDENRQPER